MLSISRTVHKKNYLWALNSCIKSGFVGWLSFSLRVSFRKKKVFRSYATISSIFSDDLLGKSNSLKEIAQSVQETDEKKMLYNYDVIIQCV